MSRFEDDAAHDPPAPVLPLRVAHPEGGEAVPVPAFVDTGADCTLVPAGVARWLRLPRIDWVEIAGVAGPVRRLAVHAALVELAGLRLVARVVPFEGEALVGRDLLSRLVVRLDGPRRVLEVATSGARRRRGR